MAIITPIGSSKPVQASFGGTGDSTILAHAVLIGEGTGNIASAGPGTTGQVLTGVTGSDPTWQSPAASSISITGNSGGALTGNAFTFTGGTSGLTFAGAGSTETLGGTLVVSNGGTGASTLTGVLIGNGTSAVTVSTTTQYNVLVGNTGNTIANVAPSATSGIPLISQGVAANPTFGTAVVAGGGTGAVSLTGVLTGNGTSAVTANAVTQYGVLIGGATNAVSSLGVAATGATLMGSTGANPSFTGSPSFSGSVTAGTTITATSGAITATLGDVVVTSGNLDITALTTSTVGQITQAGSSLLHTYGNSNTFLGNTSGNFTLTGSSNAALGGETLKAATNASQNVVIGEAACGVSTTVANGVHVGFGSGYGVTGTDNVSIGFESMYYNGGYLSGGYNTLLGSGTGTNFQSSEASNILIGYGVAGTTSSSHLLVIGNGTGTGTGNINKAVICGITGITVTGTAVLVSASNQLGIAVSSRKYKDNIEDMGDESDRLYKLRPVKFTLKEYQDKSKQFGLIAEEVYEVMPEIVVLDKEGLPQSVQYHNLPALLLNEIQKLNKRITELESRCDKVWKD